MRHTRYGYWLEEAGPVEPTRPLEGDTTADVVIVGAGYLGLWTAWQLKALEPGLDVVVLEAGLAGHGPSGRNGGFVSTLWDDLPILRDRSATPARSTVCRASERAVHGIGAFCAEQGSTRTTAPAARCRSRRATAQVGDWDELVEACAAVGAPDEARRCRGRGRDAMRVAGLPRRPAAPDGGERAAGAPRARAPREGDRAGRPAPRADARCGAVERGTASTARERCGPTRPCSP